MTNHNRLVYELLVVGETTFTFGWVVRPTAVGQRLADAILIWYVDVMLLMFLE